MIEPGTSAGGVPVQLENANGTIINPATGFAIPPYNVILITYTDSTKNTISTIQYKLGAATVATITLTQASTTDTYTQS